MKMLVLMLIMIGDDQNADADHDRRCGSPSCALSRVSFIDKLDTQLQKTPDKCMSYSLLFHAPVCMLACTA